MNPQGYVPPPPPMPMPAPPPPRSGNTACLTVGVVILAVVVLCGGLMAAILFPVFAKSREKAMQTSCLSNERQLATALLSYAQDYDERFPPPTHWCEGVSPYIRNQAVLVCPSLGGYRSNYWLSDPVPGRALAEFHNPASTILAFEARDSWDRTGTETDMERPHNSGGNVAFVDGHAKWLGPTSAVTVEWKPTWSPRAADEPVGQSEAQMPAGSPTESTSVDGAPAESSPREDAEPRPPGWRDDWS